VPCGLLVPRVDESQAVVERCLVDCVEMPAVQREDGVDVRLQQHPYEDLAAVDRRHAAMLGRGRKRGTGRLARPFVTMPQAGEGELRQRP
jgi:hypothetical protein